MDHIAAARGTSMRFLLDIIELYPSQFSPRLQERGGWLIGLFVTNDSALNEDQEALVPVPEELLVAWTEH